jgi:putative transposase
VEVRLDEMYVKVNGEMLPMARRGPRGRGARELRHEDRDKTAGLKFMKRAMKRFGRPEAITTDGLRSYRGDE